ncbi:hypothetical protein EVJ58_g5389 [Rhodofomes roseus]|nr:hypothetical protein EVJ58_g5389 [Rhodofomes roseus]
MGFTTRYSTGLGYKEGTLAGVHHRTEHERESSASTSGGVSDHESLSDLTELSDDEEIVEPSATEESESDESDDEQSAHDYLNAPLLGYDFEKGESVWVYAYDGWYCGSVMRRVESPDRPKVVQFRVLFRRYVRIQKDFAPSDGTIKPDTPRIRQMLRAAKCLPQ